MNPPLHTEQQLIGAILSDGSLFGDVVSIIDAGHFSQIEHIKAYTAMSQLFNARKPIDVVTVSEKVGHGPDEVDPFPYLAELGVGVFTLKNVTAYANTIAEYGLEKELAGAAVRMQGVIDGGEEPRDKLEKAQSIFSAIEFGGTGGGAVMAKEVMKEAVEELDKRFNSTESIIGIPTGLRHLDELTHGLQEPDLIIIAARPSQGKEQRNDSLVLLRSGQWIRIDELSIGDQLASIDGGESSVSGLFPQGIKDTFKVTFSDGRSVVVGIDHQWEIMYRDWDQPRVVSTGWLIDKLNRKRYQGRLYIAALSGDFGDSEVAVHPYLMGVLLGDGGLTGKSISLTTCEEFILNKISTMLNGCRLQQNGNTTSYYITTHRGKDNDLLSAMKEYGLMGLGSHQKFIPGEYLSAPRDIRLNLLNGLMDTDGEVGKDGCTSYSTTSHQLAIDVQSLVRSLGGWAKLSSRQTYYPYKGEIRKGKLCYKISINLKDNQSIVSLPRKKDRISPTARSRSLNVRSIVKVGTDECMCIAVTHPRKLYITDDYITTHNSLLMMKLAAAACDDGKGALIFSMEMSRTQLINRSSSALSRIPFERIQSGKLLDEDWGLYTSAAQKIAEWNMAIDDTPALTINELTNRAEKFCAKNPVSAIFVDYLQLMKADGRSRNEEVSEMSAGLKCLAKSLNLPVVALSQLSRNVEGRPDKRPNMSDLRDSGAIEADADLIAFIYRDEVYNPNSVHKGIAEVIIRKHRNGPLGTIHLETNFHVCRFDDYEGVLPVAEEKSTMKKRWEG